MKQIKMKIISRRNVLYLLGGTTGSVLFSKYALSKPNLALNKIKEIITMSSVLYPCTRDVYKKRSSK